MLRKLRKNIFTNCELCDKIYSYRDIGEAVLTSQTGCDPLGCCQIYLLEAARGSLHTVTGECVTHTVCQSCLPEAHCNDAFVSPVRSRTFFLRRLLRVCFVRAGNAFTRFLMGCITYAVLVPHFCCRSINTCVRERAKSKVWSKDQLLSLPCRQIYYSKEKKALSISWYELQIKKGVGNV